MEAIATIARLQLHIYGAVQGVGFRPFVYRLATEMGLTGWVLNGAQGVHIEIEGSPDHLRLFRARLMAEKPTHALIRHIEQAWLPPMGEGTFSIQHSDDQGAKTAFVLPDLATCPDCLAEIFDPTNRRYRYPFTNCTNCGPRFTIIQALPYDRVSTTMRGFGMCVACRSEYDDPADRRFHAQPNACPLCGPQLALWDASGECLAVEDAALRAAADAIRRGQIVALKGLGGFHLLVDARNGAAIQLLRDRKHRPAKPLALMYPSLAAVLADCKVSDQEADLLMSSQAPIVLLCKKLGCGVNDLVAPNTHELGVMLPYTPLHHLLLHELGFAVVATSGNLANEPICIDEYDTLDRLGGLADVFLVHNRPIQRHADDSIVRVIAGEMQILRRGRGYAPLPIQIDQALPPAIAVGAHQKNTVAIGLGQEIFLSQHLGDLETTLAIEVFEQTLADLQHLYALQPTVIACDLHPDYQSTQFAHASRLPVAQVQHHYAHVLGCMADNQIQAPVLGVAWDGTGYGDDSTVWGGEFLLVDDRAYQRVGYLRPFRLVGGAVAVRQPRRVALGLLYELFGDVAFEMATAAQTDFSPSDQRILQSMLKKGLNAPVTTSAGRLFDGVASLLGLCQTTSFEGQAAMQLEHIARQDVNACYPFDRLDHGQSTVIDWGRMLHGILADQAAGVEVGIIAAKFHNTLAEMIVGMAQHAAIQQVVLTGGCFQNRYLLEGTIARLKDVGLTPCWHHQVPPNDGGIALGQMIAIARLAR